MTVEAFKIVPATENSDIENDIYHVFAWIAMFTKQIPNNNLWEISYNDS